MKRGWFAGLLAAAAVSAAAPAWCQIAPTIDLSSVNLGAGMLAPGGLPLGGPLPSLGVNMYQPSMWTAPQRYRDLKVAGRVARPGSQVPPGSRIVRLNLEGNEIPMAIDTETSTADVHFSADQEYARDLYHSILTKSIRVIADDFITDRIRRAVDTNTPIVIDGYVFDRMSPYLVVRSAEPPR